MTATAFKYGRREPKNTPALLLGNYLTGVVPQHPAVDDNFTPLAGGWKMLGNGPDVENIPNGVPVDGVGDCVAVTWANVRRLMTRLEGRERYPSLAEVIQLYKTQNPGFPRDDNGMVVQTALEYLVKHGGPDGTKAVCFAKVDHADVEEVRAAIAIFGYLWVGIGVRKQNVYQFLDGEVWDYAPSSPSDGSHSVVVGGYGAGGVGQLGGDERCITWSQETSWMDSFWSHEVGEAWVVVWPEHLGSQAFLAGVDQAALAADYTALTGRPFQPTPTPPPVPVPPPGSDLAAAVAEWWAHVKPWAVARHVGDNKRAAQASVALAREAGLQAHTTT